MPDIKCIFCNNLFSSKSALNNHHKTAKYCLKLRGNIEIRVYRCKDCDKTFSQKVTLERHMISCVKKEINKGIKKYKTDNKMLNNKIHELEKIIKDQKKQIKDLQDKLENVAVRAVSRPSSVNTVNNTIINMKPITQESLENLTNSMLTVEHIQNGGKGIGQVCFPALEENILCTDYNRRHLKWKDSSGRVMTDKKGREIQKLIGRACNTFKCRRLCEKYIHREQERDKAQGIDSFKTEERLFPFRRKMADIRSMVEGDPSELGKELIKYLCHRIGMKRTTEMMDEVDKETGAEEMNRDDKSDSEEEEIEIVLEEGSEEESDEYEVLYTGTSDGRIVPI